MSDDANEFAPAINRLLKDINQLEHDLVEKKRMVNRLCEYANLPPRFMDVGGTTLGLGNLRRDQFYGRPMATVVREYLEMRGASDKGGAGAATVTEIYDALVSGGFKFETKDVANAKRGLRIALSKNTTTFHRVGDAYGLMDWYPNARPAREPKGEQEEEEEPATPDEGETAAPEKEATSS